MRLIKSSFLFLFFVIFFLGCAGFQKQMLTPDYLEGRPKWQKALYWAGPGH